MKKYLPLIVLFLVFTPICDAFADGDIFDKLAMKAGFVGSGLRKSGFIIAGLGMIMFTFMAIFNKLQWKHLAYIMFSTALLTAMLGFISYFKAGGSTVAETSGSLNFSEQNYSGAGGGPPATSK